MVSVGDYLSEKRNVTSGVPQGSLLGVLLFQVHINDIKSCLKFSESILYADDTAIFVFGKNINVLKAKMQKKFRLTL